MPADDLRGRARLGLADAAQRGGQGHAGDECARPYGPLRACHFVGSCAIAHGVSWVRRPGCVDETKVRGRPSVILGQTLNGLVEGAAPGWRRETRGRAATVEFDLLGSVEARVDGRIVDLGHARQRCVQAVPLVDANRVVKADQFVERVWADRHPQGVRNTLYGYLSRLRQALAIAEGRILSGRRRPGSVRRSRPRPVPLGRSRVSCLRTSSPRAAGVFPRAEATAEEIAPAGRRRHIRTWNTYSYRRVPDTCAVFLRS